MKLFLYVYYMNAYINPFASLDSILNFIHVFLRHCSVRILLFDSKERDKIGKVIIFF